MSDNFIERSFKRRLLQLYWAALALSVLLIVSVALMFFYGLPKAVETAFILERFGDKIENVKSPEKLKKIVDMQDQTTQILTKIIVDFFKCTIWLLVAFAGWTVLCAYSFRLCYRNIVTNEVKPVCPADPVNGVAKEKRP